MLRSDLDELMLYFLECDPDELTDDALILEDLGCDQATAEDIIMAVERQFDITLDDDELYNVETYGDFVGVVERACEIIF